MPASIETLGLWSEPGSEIELRFMRQEDGTWKPELVVDYDRKTMRPFPECFVPTTEITRALDEAFEALVRETYEEWD